MLRGTVTKFMEIMAQRVDVLLWHQRYWVGFLAERRQLLSELDGSKRLLPAGEPVIAASFLTVAENPVTVFRV